MDTWIKINTGLVKMYQKEVNCLPLIKIILNFIFTHIGHLGFQLLAKFPVIQHVLFGSLLQFKKIEPGTLLPSARLGMMPPRRIPTAAGAHNIHLGGAHPPPTLTKQ